jgi:MFS family permease
MLVPTHDKIGLVASMSNTGGDAATRRADDERDRARAQSVHRRPFGQRLLLVVGGLVVAVLAWLAAAAFFPRWWAHRIGRVVGGSGATGVITGLVLGIAFTFLPLLAIRVAIRRDRSPRFRAILAVVAIALAVPNLLTLWIVLGRSKAAHAGERTLDVEAPDFRWSTLIGAIIGAVLFGAVLFVLSSRRRRGNELNKLRAEIRRRDDTGKSTPDGSSH